MRGTVVDDESRWTAKPAVASAFRALAFALPFVFSWLAVRAVAGHLIRPSGWVGLGVWVAQAAVVGAAVSFTIEQFSRRLLPLSVLFRLSLVFPDRAPSRFGLALRSGSAASREERIRKIRRTGLGPDEHEAAARALELTGMLSSHDRRTRGHSERVRAYADLIAEEMGLSVEDREFLAWGSLLHDIGKMEVPAEILNSSDSPSVVEWEILKGHPSAGQELIEPLEGWLGPWAGASCDHHERWDGRGYPRGLAGTDISLAGRIVAVADAYDVITSARSYKRPMSAAAARQELVLGSGTQFDPEVVRAFLGVSLGRRVLAGPLAWVLELPRLSVLGGAPLTPLVAGVVVVATSFSAPPPTPTALSYLDESTLPAVVETLAEEVSSQAPPIVGADGAPVPSTTAPASTDEPVLAESPMIEPSAEASPALPSNGPLPATGPVTPTSPTTAPTVPTTAPNAAPTTAPTSSPTTSDTPTTSTQPPPEAQWVIDDDVTTLTDEHEQIWVLANDQPLANLDYSTLRIVTGPQHGEAEIKVSGGNPANSRLRYRSDVDFEGIDTVVYEICDMNGACGRGTVTITVVSRY